MFHKRQWNEMIENLEDILGSASNIDCECGDCTVARYLLNLFDFPDKADDIDPNKIRELMKKLG